MLTWARNQLMLASQILDNPGGGLLFATQTIGQVRSGLADEGSRWHELVALLARAESHAVRRQFVPARQVLDEAIDKLREPA